MDLPEEIPEQFRDLFQNLAAHFRSAGMPLPGELKELAPEVSLRQPIKNIATQTVANICAGGSPALFLQNDVVVSIDEGTGMTRPMDARRFLSFVEHYQVCFKGRNKESGKAVPEHLPSEIAQAILVSDDFRVRLPQLAGVNRVKQPVRRRPVEGKPCGECFGCRTKGKVWNEKRKKELAGGAADEQKEKHPFCLGRVELLRPGYDAESRMFTVRLGDEALDYEEDWDLDDCIFFLKHHFKTFSWGEADGVLGVSFAVCLSLWLTLFCQSMLPPGTKKPMWLLNANLPGSGKSRLVEVILCALFGTIDYFIWSDDPRERATKFDSKALMNAPYVFLDNMRRGHIKDEFLDVWVTSATHSPRLFQTQRTMNVEKRAVTIMTGNGITLSEDLTRRSLIVDFYAHETAAERLLPKDAVDISEEWMHAPENRAKILSCLWGLLRNSELKGNLDYRPARGNAVGSGFSVWAKTIPRIAVDGGWPDPLTVVERPDTGDVDGQEVTKLLHAVVEEFLVRPEKTSVEVKLKEMVPIARKLGLFISVLETADDMLREMKQSKKTGVFQDVTKLETDEMGIERWVTGPPNEAEMLEQALSYIPAGGGAGGKGGGMLTRFGMRAGTRMRTRHVTGSNMFTYEFGSRASARESTFLIRRIN